MKRLTFPRAGLLALLGALPAWCAAASIGIVTIAEGEASVVREAQRFAVAEGLRVRDEDIVRTGPDARLVRLELADGSALDLGPDTELMLQPRAAGRFGERAATLYLMRGWLKVASGAGALTGIASAAADLHTLAGTAVLRVAPEAVLVFVESGQARVSEPDAATPEMALAEGDAFVRRGRTAPTSARRPPADLLQGLPRAFADSLPRRTARWQARPVEPGAGTPVSYAEVARWIDGEPALRALAVPRFATRAGDRAFRAALVAGVRSHPEWSRTLFPERYRPKPTVVVQRTEPQPLRFDGVMNWPLAAVTETTR